MGQVPTILFSQSELDAVKSSRLWQDMKALFEASTLHPSWKCLLSFEELYARFLNLEATLQEIAREAGVSRERIRQIYELYFHGLFPECSWLRRRGYLRTKARHKRIASLPPKNPRLLRVFESARLNGLAVTQIPIPISPHQMYSRRLSINGKCCTVSFIEKAYKYDLLWYAHTQVNPAEEDGFFIFSVHIQGVLSACFIIPNKLLFNGCSGRLNIFIPLKKPAQWYKNHKPRIDWWQYHEAWHLLS